MDERTGQVGRGSRDAEGDPTIGAIVEGSIRESPCGGQGDGSKAPRLLRERPDEIDAALWARLRQLAQMGELKGMGLANALALEKLKITRLEDLARQDPADLASKLDRRRGPVRVEEAKVWIRAAAKLASISR